MIHDMSLLLMKPMLGVEYDVSSARETPWRALRNLSNEWDGIYAYVALTNNCLVSIGSRVILGLSVDLMLLLCHIA